MMDTQDPGRNTALLGAMVDALEEHLASEDLSREVVAETREGPVPATMTLGMVIGLVRALEREMPNMLPLERERADAAFSRFERERRVHLAAYGDKMRREIAADLEAWQRFLEACEGGEDACFEAYVSEAWIRTRLQQLFQEAHSLGIDLGELRERRVEVDDRLRGLFRLGDFIGDADEAPFYPAEEYWWLYGGPMAPAAPG